MTSSDDDIDPELKEGIKNIMWVQLLWKPGFQNPHLTIYLLPTRPEQYHFFYPNANTQYFQKGLNNTQYQYQFFDESLTIPRA